MEIYGFPRLFLPIPQWVRVIWSVQWGHPPSLPPFLRPSHPFSPSLIKHSPLLHAVGPSRRRKDGSGLVGGGAKTKRICRGGGDWRIGYCIHEANWSWISFLVRMDDSLVRQPVNSTCCTPIYPHPLGVVKYEKYLFCNIFQDGNFQRALHHLSRCINRCEGCIGCRLNFSRCFPQSLLFLCQKLSA